MYYELEEFPKHDSSSRKAREALKRWSRRSGSPSSGRSSLDSPLEQRDSYQDALDKPIEEQDSGLDKQGSSGLDKRGSLELTRSVPPVPEDSVVDAATILRSSGACVRELVSTSSGVTDKARISPSLCRSPPEVLADLRLTAVPASGIERSCPVLELRVRGIQLCTLVLLLLSISADTAPST